MDEFGRTRHFGIRRKALLEPILHRLDVVIGARFDGLDRLTIGNREVAHHSVKLSQRGRAERRDLGQLPFGGKRLQPLDFDPHTVADQSVLGKMGTQGADLVLVAAIERRKCHEGHEGGSGGRRHDHIPARQKRVF